MLISLTVGKVDAGVAVLLTEDKRLIEFPSILLPDSITSGSIVDITVSRNLSSESTSQHAFSALQSSILNTYGLTSPSPPVLRCRNATQTSIVLEWDKLSLATATLRSLSLYRNGAKAGNIPYQTPAPGSTKEPITSTKISGLAVDTEYTFHLQLRTSAGTYTSSKLHVRTQKMTDLTGVTITPGPMPQPLLSALQAAVERIGMKLAETVRIDTTHFVCTEGRGREWEKALELNVPVVRPEWVDGCEREGRIVGVRGYYLGADPKLRNPGNSVSAQGGQPQQQQQQQQQRPSQQEQVPTRERERAPENGASPPSTHPDADADTETNSLPPPTPAKDYRPAASSPSAEPSADGESEEDDDDDKKPATHGIQNQQHNPEENDEQTSTSPISPISSSPDGRKTDDKDSGTPPAGNSKEGEVEDDVDGGNRTPGGFSEVAL